MLERVLLNSSVKLVRSNTSLEAGLWISISCVAKNKLFSWARTFLFFRIELLLGYHRVERAVASGLGFLIFHYSSSQWGNSLGRVLTLAK